MSVKKISKKITGENELDALIHSPEEKGSYPAILLCHGFLSAKEEYGDLPENLAKQGYVVLSFDFSGHGKSKGDRGYFRSISHIDDTERALKTLLEQENVIKDRVAVIGHSMGSVAATRILTESEIGKKSKTAILMAPVKTFSDSVGKLELKAYEIASKVAWPLLLLTGKHIYIPYKFGSKDIFVGKEAIDRAEKLKFLQKKMTVNNYYYMVKQIDNKKYASLVDKPTLVLVAKGDKLIPNAGSMEVFNALNTEDKKYVEIDNTGHSMMDDLSKDKVEQEIVNWLKEKL